VLDNFPGNPKAPAAQLRKGEAELAISQRDAGIRDLRALISRYPQTPEAAQARSRLSGMGVRTTASKPSGYRQ
jgi:TolA-binding protein